MSRKRDRIEVLAEILSICKTPHTKTFIRCHTSVSYEVLQSSIMQLVKRQWLLQDGEGCGQPKFTITAKGRTFLKKWLELQQILGLDIKAVNSNSHGFPADIRVETASVPSSSRSTRSE
ncbi:hypothetical protein GX563_06435 [Candidatus Bathyarchaeota archaeon]|nr:hypothetical protein [Candidatus Bathyarchaeota archaeon]